MLGRGLQTRVPKDEGLCFLGAWRGIVIVKVMAMMVEMVEVMIEVFFNFLIMHTP